MKKLIVLASILFSACAVKHFDTDGPCQSAGDTETAKNMAKGLCAMYEDSKYEVVEVRVRETSRGEFFVRTRQTSGALIGETDRLSREELQFSMPYIFAWYGDVRSVRWVMEDPAGRKTVRWRR